MSEVLRCVCRANAIHNIALLNHYLFISKSRSKVKVTNFDVCKLKVFSRQCSLIDYGTWFLYLYSSSVWYISTTSPTVTCVNSLGFNRISSPETKIKAVFSEENYVPPNCNLSQQAWLTALYCVTMIHQLFQGRACTDTRSRSSKSY